jgi:hypothetical protein
VAGFLGLLCEQRGTGSPQWQWGISHSEGQGVGVGLLSAAYFGDFDDFDPIPDWNHQHLGRSYDALHSFASILIPHTNNATDGDILIRSRPVDCRSALTWTRDIKTAGSPSPVPSATLC